MLYLTNVLFGFFTTPYLVASPPTIPLNLTIILTYLHHGGPDDRTADSIHIGGGQVYVGTLGLILHPRYHCNFRPYVLLHRCGHHFRDPDLLRSDPIPLYIPTDRCVCGISICPNFETTRLSRDSGFHRRSCAS